MPKKRTIFTIGHSTHTTREFIKILRAYGVEVVVDVRHYPGSRYCPQFGKTRLKNNLARNNIDYHHIIELGGRRRPDRNLHVNEGWRSLQFRGYADHMQMDEFQDGLKELMSIARKRISVIMCSEAVPWRCHRSMIADALLINGFDVLDIFSQASVRPHKLTPFAKVIKKKITYPLKD